MSNENRSYYYSNQSGSRDSNHGGSRSKYYQRDNNYDQNHNRRRTNLILPPPSILQAYEDLVEGAAERIIEMAEIEQTHRHDWEISSLRVYARNHKLGQFLGFILAITLIAACFKLSQLGDYFTSSALAIGGFSCLIITSLVATRSRRYEKRIRSSRGNSYNNHYSQDSNNDDN